MNTNKLLLLLLLPGVRWSRSTLLYSRSIVARRDRGESSQERSTAELVGTCHTVQCLHMCTCIARGPHAHTLLFALIHIVSLPRTYLHLHLHVDTVQTHAGARLHTHTHTTHAYIHAHPPSPSPPGACPRRPPQEVPQAPPHGVCCLCWACVPSGSATRQLWCPSYRPTFIRCLSINPDPPPPPPPPPPHHFLLQPTFKSSGRSVRLIKAALAAAQAGTCNVHRQCDTMRQHAIRWRVCGCVRACACNALPRVEIWSVCARFCVRARACMRVRALYVGDHAHACSYTVLSRYVQSCTRQFIGARANPDCARACVRARLQ